MVSCCPDRGPSTDFLVYSHSWRMEFYLLPSVAFPRAFRVIAIRLVLVKAQPLKALVRVTFTQEQVYRRSYGVLLEP